jgi:hypothetical protein
MEFYMSQFIKNLIFEDESLYLEYKSKWYWNENEKPSERQWGEFLKDFVALVNCNEKCIEDIKYLIIGIDENKEKIEERVLNVNFLEDKKFSDLNILKLEILQKLKTFFRLESNNEEMYTEFSINSYIISNKKILVFELLPTRSLLILNKNLLDKTRTEKKNNVYIRELKSKNDPEVTNAAPESLFDLSKKLNEYKKRRDKEEKKDKSIEKTINLFIQNNDTYELDTPKKEKLWKENILYEIYPVKSDFINIDFIYIYDKTSQQKTFKYLKNNNLLTNDAKTWIII